MKITILLLMGSNVLLGCQRSSQGVDRDTEEYAVISSVLDTLYSGDPYLVGKEVWIRDSTQRPPDTLDGFKSVWPNPQRYKVTVGAPVPVADDSVPPKPIEPRPSHKSDLHYEGAVTQQNIFEELKSGLPTLDWEDLVQCFGRRNMAQQVLDSASLSIRGSFKVLPDERTRNLSLEDMFRSIHGGRLIRFSRVGFNGTNDQAIVFSEVTPDGYSCMFLVLEKQSTRWVVLKGIGYWGI